MLLEYFCHLNNSKLKFIIACFTRLKMFNDFEVNRLIETFIQMRFTGVFILRYEFCQTGPTLVKNIKFVEYCVLICNSFLAIILSSGTFFLSFSFKTCLMLFVKELVLCFVNRSLP